MVKANTSNRERYNAEQNFSSYFVLQFLRYCDSKRTNRNTVNSVGIKQLSTNQADI